MPSNNNRSTDQAYFASIQDSWSYMGTSSGLSIICLLRAYSAQLGVLVHCYISGRSQYLARFFSLCQITDVHTIHPPNGGLLLPTSIEPTMLPDLTPKQLYYKCAPLHSAKIITFSGQKLDHTKYVPHQTDHLETSKALQEFTKCGCNPLKGCTGHTKCCKAELTCTNLCICNSECERI